MPTLLTQMRDEIWRGVQIPPQGPHVEELFEGALKGGLPRLSEDFTESPMKKLGR
jgi:hypothetical protein